MRSIRRLDLDIDDRANTGVEFFAIFNVQRRLTHFGEHQARRSRRAKDRLRNGSFEKDGATVYTVDLVTEDFHFLNKHQPKGDATATPDRQQPSRY